MQSIYKLQIAFTVYTESHNFG